MPMRPSCQDTVVTWASHDKGLGYNLFPTDGRAPQGYESGSALPDYKSPRLPSDEDFWALIRTGRGTVNTP